MKNEIESNVELQLLDFNEDDINFDSKTIFLDFYTPVSKAMRSDLLNELKNYEYLVDANLKIKGGSTDNFELVKSLLNEKRDEVRKQRDKIIRLESKVLKLENEVVDLSGENPLDFLVVSKDAKINFSELKSLSFAKEFHSNFKKIDTLAVARPIWMGKIDDSVLKIKNRELAIWLSNQLKLDTIYIKD